MSDPIAAVTAPSLWDSIKLNVGLLGFLISVVLAVVKGAEIYHARRDRSRDQRAKVNDAWFKTIVLDGAIPSIRSFLETQRGALKQACSAHPGTARPYMAVWLRYKPESEELMIRLIPIEELSSNAYAALVHYLEILEDSVSPFCSHADDRSVDPGSIEKEWLALQHQMDRCFRDCLSILRRVHFELSRGRDPDQTISKPTP
jgi:hypothetical protein